MSDSQPPIELEKLTKAEANGGRKRDTAERERDTTIEVNMWTLSFTHKEIADFISNCRDGVPRGYTIGKQTVGNDIKEWRSKWAMARVEDVNSYLIKLIAGHEANIRNAYDAYVQSSTIKIETTTETEPQRDKDGNAIQKVTRTTTKRIRRDPDVACLAEIRQNQVAIARLMGLEPPREWRIGLAKESFGFEDMMKVAQSNERSELDEHADEI